MAKRPRDWRQQIKESRHAFLVRSYDQQGLYHDTLGYYFCGEEAEDVRREFEERHPEYEYSIEEFDRSHDLRKFRDAERRGIARG